MARKGNYKFSDKIHPAKGVISTGIGVVTVLGLLALCIISSRSKGNGGLLLGSLGLVVFVFSIIGFVLAILSIKQKEIHYSFPVVGIMINGIIMTICFILYVLGACL